MTEISLSKVDKLIRNVLMKSDKPLSTYEIAKKTDLSWSTANTHCYKLKSFGIVNGKNEETKTGMKRVVWWLVK
jgi:predicted transcriptional regulator